MSNQNTNTYILLLPPPPPDHHHSLKSDVLDARELGPMDLDPSMGEAMTRVGTSADRQRIPSINHPMGFGSGYY